MRSKSFKIIVLLLFVSAIAGAAYYMYVSWVLKSPYHQIENESPN
jgi:uncharacterized protein YpmB